MSELLNKHDLMNLLPHRDPFLLVDEVQILEKGETAEAVFHVLPTLDFFKGHFPGNPILPGVLQIEIMAQTAGVVVLHAHEKKENLRVFLTSVESAKFKKTVVPPSDLKICVKKIKEKCSIFVFEGKCFVNDELVSQATFSALLG